jgi:hypothetical protein
VMDGLASRMADAGLAQIAPSPKLSSLKSD